MLGQLIKKIFGDPQEKVVKNYTPAVEKINALEPEIEKLSDEELKNKTKEFRERLAKGEALDDLLAEAFAVVRETSKRTLKMRHFDVQLIGGIVLHEGKIAEMKTGEGKTVVATLTAYLNALPGNPVYIVTVNDYLARRDCEWMSAIYEFLGLSVGVIQSAMSPDERQQAYACDIIYGTNNEFGFDYLRDNLSMDISQCCQNRRYFAIVDEVDSILIDEARTPLIISGPVQDSTSKYIKIASMIKNLHKDLHFTLDEKHKNAVLTEEGINKLEKDLQLKDIFSVENMDTAHMAVQCIKAKYLFKRDVDYVVKSGEVMIVDEFTGRLMEGRRYSDGLHQAIEAVERLVIRNESQTLASITFQNYFRMFPKLAGMTGTAATEAAEFEKIYSLEVVIIPTNEVMVRNDQADVIYKTKEEKYKAIARDVKERYGKGQPILLGTISIETSELLSLLLKKEGVPHNVLNAKQHEKEAEIIAKAGQPQAVTIATNMAGRGTDIVLGAGVVGKGGLYVIGSERHESRRIDNQLRGRSGRQGDPGLSRFYVALNDDLMRMFGSDRIATMMDRLGVPSDTPIEHKWISKAIERAQSKVEKYHFSIRKQILQYDDVLNKQRGAVYGLRRQILKKEDLDGKILEFISDIVRKRFAEFFLDEQLCKVDGAVVNNFITWMHKIFPIENLSIILGAMIKNKNSQDEAIAKLIEVCNECYFLRSRSYPEEIFQEYVVKRSLLYVLDRKWMDHLHNIDALREGIGLRAWGQRDPLMEYKIEAFEMFSDLLLNVGEEALEIINRAVVVEQGQEEDAFEDQSQMYYNKTESHSPVLTSRKTNKIGRNDPCPCGSGRKYKKCCMK
ncbi:preprotein translocase subunit SecA [Candidatus Margulisiibacteriota bacterium]